MIDSLNVLLGDKRREGAYFSSFGQMCQKMQQLRKPKKCHRQQLLIYGSQSAEPTLRLFGITVVTNCVDFSVINTQQDG